ncbi:hypothetical protein ACFQ3Z_23505 [Streptomyces nogalater]
MPSFQGITVTSVQPISPPPARLGVPVRRPGRDARAPSVADGAVGSSWAPCSRPRSWALEACS